MNSRENRTPDRRREPITDTQLLLTITICIFVFMYGLAMLVWGGGFLKPQMLFDLLNDNAFLIIISCGLTIVMITGSIDISVGGVTALVAMVGVMILNGSFGPFVKLQEALGLPDGARIVFALFATYQDCFLYALLKSNAKPIQAKMTIVVFYQH